jgi:hypothetical protein
MKDNQAELRRALQDWRVTTPVPSRFQEQVWNRIERAEVPGVSLAEALRTRLAAWFAQPALAIAYVTVLIAAGLALGFKQAQHRTAKWDRQLETRYVQSIDPYQRVSD